jgi:hypothetical protein
MKNVYKLSNKELAKKLSAEERQVRLNKASKEYMRGRISRKQFQQAERDYGTDYTLVTFGLAREQRVLPRFIKSLASIFSNK